MPHPDTENLTPYRAEALHLVDEEFFPLLTLAVKATFDIEPNGMLVLSAKQVPLNFGGEFTDPEAEESSYRFEPEVAPIKLATDVVLVGHAHARDSRTTQMDVGFSVGTLVKALRVFGERAWYRSTGEMSMTSPKTFATMPIVYERAFGGWDRSHPEDSKHGFEARNPVGRGFHAKRGTYREGIYLANVEDAKDPITSHTDRPAPGGFGFVSPNWQPRARLAGTYGELWDKTRKPLLPTDFDRRHFNAASPGLIAPGYLRGDEAVQTLGLSPGGQLGFKLPGLPPPTVRVKLPSQADQTPQANLDTVIVDLDNLQLMMIWRACMPVPDGPHGVDGIVFSCPEAAKFPRAEVVKDPTVAANRGE